MRGFKLIASLFLIVALGSLLFGQTQTGTITGKVTDETGAVLPGVTVTATSEALIGPRTMVTTETGSYQFVSLPPGFYDIKFELEGFTTVERKEIRIAVGFIARINATLTLAPLEETITVTGESPVVDVKSVLKATTFDSSLLDNLPSARDPWVMVAMAPGAQSSLFNIGGTESFQQYGVTVHGAGGSNIQMDGLLINWTGGSTMLYYGFSMFKELAFQTNAQPAEIDSPDVTWNMVTNSGGNEFHGSATFLFMNRGMASKNVTPEQEEAGMTGNPVDKSWDLDVNFGGPIMRDKIWFFSNVRYWRMDQVMIGAKMLPGQKSWIDDNSIRNFFGKVTYQINPTNTIAYNWNRNYKYRYHRLPVDPRTWLCEPDATYFQNQISNTTQGQFTSIISDRAFLDIRAGIQFGTFPLRWQDNVDTATTIGKRDNGYMLYYDAPHTRFLNPQYRFSLNSSYSYFLDDFMGGAHSFKAGLQFGRCFARYEYRTNDYGIAQRYMYGEPLEVILYNYPVDTEATWHSYGIYVQDDYTIKDRLTLSLGVRYDRYHGWVPAHTSPEGPWFPAQSTEKIDNIPLWNNIAPRLGFAFDLFGDGKTAIKGNYSRYYGRISHGIMLNVDPTGTGTDTRTWTDLNGDDIAQFEEMGLSTGWRIGAKRSQDPNLRNSYHDEFTLGIEREVATDFNLGVTYYHRRMRDSYDSQNVAISPDNFTPVTIDNPLGGTLTVYEIDPAYRAAYKAVYMNNPLEDYEYNGLEFTWTKRYSKGWQLMGGFTIQRAYGGLGGDPHNPNSLVNREGIVGNDSPYMFKIIGSYMLPYGILLGGNYRYQVGYPLSVNLYVRGFEQGTFTVRPDTRGDHRHDNLSLLDLKVSKIFNIKDYKLELMLDLYNMFNSGIARSRITTAGNAYKTGSTLAANFLDPTMIVTPRTVRVGARFTF